MAYSRCLTGRCDRPGSRTLRAPLSRTERRERPWLRSPARSTEPARPALRMQAGRRALRSRDRHIASTFVKRDGGLCAAGIGTLLPEQRHIRFGDLAILVEIHRIVRSGCGVQPRPHQIHILLINYPVVVEIQIAVVQQEDLGPAEPARRAHIESKGSAGKTPASRIVAITQTNLADK